MNLTDKKSPGARGVPRPSNQQAGHAPRIKPAAARPQTGPSAQGVKRPAAPTAFRPPAAPKAVQPKAANGAVKWKAPAAPPAPCPRQAPKVLQAKRPPGQSTPAGRATRLPVAPPPRQTEPAKVVRPMAVSRQQPRPPAAAAVPRRPYQKIAVQPKMATAAAAHAGPRRNQNAGLAGRGGAVVQPSKDKAVNFVKGAIGGLVSYAMGREVGKEVKRQYNKQVRHEYRLEVEIHTDKSPKELRNMHMKFFNSKLLHNVAMEYLRWTGSLITHQSYKSLEYDEVGHEKTSELMPGYKPILSAPITTVVSDDEVNGVYSFSNFTKLPHPLHDGNIVASYQRTERGTILCTIVGMGFGKKFWQFLNNKMMPELFQPQITQIGRQLGLKDRPKLKKVSEKIEEIE